MWLIISLVYKLNIPKLSHARLSINGQRLQHYWTLLNKVTGQRIRNNKGGLSVSVSPLKTSVWTPYGQFYWSFNSFVGKIAVNFIYSWSFLRKRRRNGWRYCYTPTHQSRPLWLAFNGLKLLKGLKGLKGFQMPGQRFMSQVTCCPVCWRHWISINIFKTI